MFSNVCKHRLIIYGCFKCDFNKVKRIKKKFTKKKIKNKKNCENSKFDNPRFLGAFYYHGTMNVPCISKQESIRNWRTYCGQYLVKGVHKISCHGMFVSLTCYFQRNLFLVFFSDQKSQTYRVEF